MVSRVVSSTAADESSPPVRPSSAVASAWRASLMRWRITAASAWAEIDAEIDADAGAPAGAGASAAPGPAPSSSAIWMLRSSRISWSRSACSKSSRSTAAVLSFSVTALFRRSSASCSGTPTAPLPCWEGGCLAALEMIEMIEAGDSTFGWPSRSRSCPASALGASSTGPSGILCPLNFTPATSFMEAASLSAASSASASSLACWRLEACDARSSCTAAAAPSLAASALAFSSRSAISSAVSSRTCA